MSWLLFLDESGHDHRQMPYEVRSGIALKDSKLWPFVQAMQRLELDCFGCQLHLYRKELKGSTLLDTKRFRFSQQAGAMEPEARRKHCRGFFTKGLEKKSPIREEFTAYGQACLEMARGIFQLLRDQGAVLFASVIPRQTTKPAGSQVCPTVGSLFYAHGDGTISHSMDRSHAVFRLIRHGLPGPSGRSLHLLPQLGISFAVARDGRGEAR